MVLSTLRCGLWGALCLAGAAAAAPAERVPGSVGFSAVAALPVPSPVATVRYGPAGPQHAELYLPAGSAPAPVVVLVHGGCWLNAYGLDHIRALAGALAAEGYAVWSLEYRRVGDDGGGWPGTGNDVQAAVAALTFAPFSERFDLQRLAVLGHSAGGHLALWLAQAIGPIPFRRLSWPWVSRPLPICLPTPRVIIPARWPRPSSLGAAGNGAGGSLQQPTPFQKRRGQRPLRSFTAPRIPS